ncbi:uncharacterized protein LOC132696213 [Cylas formicarius]|uniref:uncharacterized protein LOC132696213 n=1 Tax=Cylas formicarius TaxID=197179 RepID=UPI0029588014|nr:uncharacterized protein LOC132696213 [Cylas formicarius]
MLRQAIGMRKIDVAVLSEPNKKIATRNKWQTDDNLDLAIQVINNSGHSQYSGKGIGFVWINYLDIVIYSCYIFPNEGEETYLRFLHHLKLSIRNQRNQCLICGDFNAKSVMWGSPINDHKGDILSEWCSELDLVMLNRGTMPTFKKGTSESFIDVSFATSRLATRILSWEVSDEENLSDHNFIFLDIKEDSVSETNSSEQKPKQLGWSVDHTKIEEFLITLEKRLLSVKSTKDMTPKAWSEIITGACNSIFMRKKKLGANKKPVYWWKSQTAKLRKECLLKKRTIEKPAQA